jgi:hypothetical protein
MKLTALLGYFNNAGVEVSPRQHLGKTRRLSTIRRKRFKINH